MKSKIHEHTTKKTILGIRKTLKFLSIALILTVGMILGLQSCRKDYETVNPSSQHNQKVRIVNSKDIQELINKIEQNSAEFSFAKKSNTQLDLEKILEVSDTNGYVNYTFKIKNLYKKDSLFHISNLIVKTDSLGNIVNDFIMDYGVRDRDMFDYIFNHKNLNNFNGILSIYSTYDYTYNMNKNVNGKSNEGYTDPCITVNVGSSGGDSTSDNLTNWNGYDSEGTSGGGGFDDMFYLEFNMWLYGGEKTDFEIISPRFFMITPNFMVNFIFGYNATNDDPCSNITAGSYGLIAFNEEDIQNYLINIGIENCNQDMLNWIMNNENTFYQMVDLLYDEDYSPEAMAFVWQAVEAELNGGEVDFENRIIFPAIWENYPCQKEIVQATCNGLGKVGNDMQLIFTDNDIFDQKIYLQYNIAYIPSSPTSQVMAETTYDFDSNMNLTNIDITFQTQLINQSTDLGIYSIAIHENLHALLTVYLENNGIYPEGGVFNDSALLGLLVDIYAERKAEVLKTSNPNFVTSDIAWLQHEIISELVSVMAEEIKAYGNSKGYIIDNYVYEWLAWNGLQGSDAFEEYTGNEQFVIDAISMVQTNEALNNSLAHGRSCY